MSQWHLKKIYDALARKGWRISAGEVDEPFEHAKSWRIQRSTLIAPLELAFDCWDGMGYPTMVDKAYAADIRKHNVSLYFSRTRTFPPLLKEFLTKLDHLEASLCQLRNGENATQPECVISDTT